MGQMKRKHQRGSSDAGMVITLLGLACLISVALLVNGWIKSKNLARRGVSEMTESEYQQLQEEGGEYQVEYLKD